MDVVLNDQLGTSRLKGEFTFFQSLSRFFVPIYLSKVGEPPGVEFLGCLSKFREKLEK